MVATGCDSGLLSAAHDGCSGRPELRLLFDRETAAQRHLLAVGFVYLDRPTLTGGMYDSVVNAALALNGVAGADERGTTFDDAVAAMLSVFADDGLDEATAAASIEQQCSDLTRAVQQLLYLCADEPDITDIDAPGDRPGRVEGGTKKRWTAAMRARQWDVGYRIANSLRAHQTGAGEPNKRPGERLGPRPHLRAAHWHLYWTGPGRTEPRVRWVMPTPVGHADDLPTVERRALGPTNNG